MPKELFVYDRVEAANEAAVACAVVGPRHLEVFDACA
jgi:hypothetical protein